MKKMGFARGAGATLSDSDDDIFVPTPSSTSKRAESAPRREFLSCGSLSSDNEGCVWDSEVENKHGFGYKLSRQGSIVDGLLHEIYDRWHGSFRDSFDSDTFTECSSTSEVFLSRWDSMNSPYERRHARQFSRAFLENQNISQLRKMFGDIQRSINQSSTRLVRQLKCRDRRIAKLHRNCDVVTAILQAASLKRQIDTRMRFSIQPPPGESAFEQWKDAMKAVARLPLGIPQEFRKKVWLSLANHYIKDLKIDWEKTVRFAFNERSNPDDDKLGLQIVKDLHRTGCSSYSGQDNEQDRAVLKRVLLAYARWNKRVGYCQGFNVIAALLLDVMDRKEDDALMVMIYLIDHVLPESYFANNLRALSVDMAVFRDLLRFTYPHLAKHLNHLQNAAQDITTGRQNSYLQNAAQDITTGACYEPPLTNVFTMQWFLTLFATCLPKSIVLRVWDSILLEGSEILLRTALTIWGKLARRIKSVTSADEFYTLMGDLAADMIQGTIFNADDFIKSIYSLSPFPFPQLSELREKYTYNIRPFTNTANTGKKGGSRVAKNVLYSDEDDLDDEDIEAITCFQGFVPQGMKGRGDGDLGSGSADISALGPGAYGIHPDAQGAGPVYMERMCTDIGSLQKQYEKLRLRQRQAHIIISAASARQSPKPKATVLVPKIESPLAMNHLFIGKHAGGRNRLVAEGPKIVSVFNHCEKYPQLEGPIRREKRSSSASSAKSEPKRESFSSCGTLEDMSEGVSRDREGSEGEMPMSSPDIMQGEDLDLSQFDTSGSIEEKTENVNNNASVDMVSDARPVSSDSVDGRMVADVHHVDAVIPADADAVNSGADSLPNGADVVSGSNETLCSQPDITVSDARTDSLTFDRGVMNDSVTEDYPGSRYKNSIDKENLKMDRYSRPKPDLRLKFSTRNSSTSESDTGPSPNQMHTDMLTKFVYIASKQHNNKTKSSRSSSSSSQSTTPTTPDVFNSVKPSSPTKPFKPFPMKQLNSNRAKNGLKLGLYTSSTLQQLEKQGKRSQGSFFKVKNAS
ncbi:TBC1 domain family member 30-like isoform X1 [Haliotis rufescens]|uniref:TBC1 domain family member 30-like isoform X1 n=1 Tax=Haliotis rufescens TaxID=6454 RepID=UPI00201F3E51|nr:TBC1 domain family member 30-like isoform X1 [Haliotis rufescens]